MLASGLRADDCIHVYIAGPLSKGDMMGNARDAILSGSELLSMGVIPFIPHLSVLWEMIDPHSYEDWMAYDFAWLARCDAVLRLPGESPGADREVERAKSLGKRVFTRLNDVYEWAKERKR